LSVDILTTFDDSQPLVLAHQDLNPRNFIVGDDSHMWLVDWAWAGFYLPWFEFVAMRRQAEKRRVTHKAEEPRLGCYDPFYPWSVFRAGKVARSHGYVSRVGLTKFFRTWIQLSPHLSIGSGRFDITYFLCSSLMRFINNRVRSKPFLHSSHAHVNIIFPCAKEFTTTE